MRLDVLMAQRQLAKSRESAKTLIKDGMVQVDGVLCTKPSEELEGTEKITVLESDVYVGRGALKLRKAIEEFSICLENATCLDIGASTGGFTDYMLRGGAKKVYALDVGHGQLAEKLISDSRVVNMEGTNIRLLPENYFEDTIDFICIDVSFISLTQVLPKAFEIAGDSGKIVALIKPQFEAGRENLNKNGIVKLPKSHKTVLSEIISFSMKYTNICGLTYSPVARKDGNIEYLLYMSGNGNEVFPDVTKIVAEAFEKVKFDK